MERLRLLVEGVNNKIRVLQRRAYGYPDEEYLKLKIVAAFLPPLPRNAVCLLFIHPCAPNLISLRSAGTMPA